MNMFYLRSKGIDPLIAHGVEITTGITDGHMAQRVQSMILLLFFQQRGVSFRQQAFPLSAVGWGGRLRKMQSVTMAEGRKWKSQDLVSWSRCNLVLLLPLGWTLVLTWWAWWSWRAFLLSATCILLSIPFPSLWIIRIRLFHHWVQLCLKYVFCTGSIKEFLHWFLTCFYLSILKTLKRIEFSQSQVPYL